MELTFKLILSLLLLCGFVAPHGLLTKPKPRNLFAALRADDKGEPEWCPHCMNRPDIIGAFGTQPYYEFDDDRTIQRFSICGVAQDNYSHKYTEGKGHWTKEWIPHQSLGESNVIENFAGGDELDIEFEITANHRGYIEVSICQEDPPTMACFNRGLMKRKPETTLWMTSAGGTVIPYNPLKPHQVFVPPPDCGEPIGPNNGQQVRATVLFPAGLQSDKMSTIRWRYVTANSCVPPGFKDFFKNRSGPQGCPTMPWSNLNMANCGAGSEAWEEFANCADIWIGTAQAHNDKYLGGKPGAPQVGNPSPVPPQGPTNPAPTRPSPTLPPQAPTNPTPTPPLPTPPMPSPPTTDCASLSDIHIDCKQSWFIAGVATFCSEDPWWAEQCKKTCCTYSSPSNPPPTPTPPSPPPPSTDCDSLSDIDNRCKLSWFINGVAGYCSEGNWWAGQCKKTCCTYSSPSCDSLSDTNNDCNKSWFINGVAGYCSEGNWWAGQCKKTCCTYSSDPDQRKTSERTDSDGDSTTTTTITPAHFERTTAFTVFGTLVVLVATALVGFKMGERSRARDGVVEVPLETSTTTSSLLPLTPRTKEHTRRLTPRTKETLKAFDAM